MVMVTISRGLPRTCDFIHSFSHSFNSCLLSAPSSGPVLLLQLIGVQTGHDLGPGGACILVKELNREQTKVMTEGDSVSAPGY